MLIRHIIENTLKDFTNFFQVYKAGNNYQEPYLFNKGLALPCQICPFKFYLEADRDQKCLQVNPSLEIALHLANEIVDLIVDSLNDIPRLEILLFENVKDFIKLKYVNLIDKKEDIVLECKQTFKDVLISNSHGFK